MSAYAVRGFAGGIATAANANHVAALWNPSSTRRITVVEVSAYLCDFNTQAQNALYLQRTTTRGTPTSTVTPDADNEGKRASAPPSGALLDLAEFTALPTLATPPLQSMMAMPTVSGMEGSGFLWPCPRGIILPPGTGLAVIQKQQETYTGGWEVHYVFED